MSAVRFKGMADASIGLVCKYGNNRSGDRKSQEKWFTDVYGEEERDTPERKDKMKKIGILAASILLVAGAAWAKDNSGAKSDELTKASQTLQQITSSNQIPQ